MPAPRIAFGSNADQAAGRFAREFAAARAVAGLTQQQVARRAGVSQALVSLAEAGITVPSLRVMGRLAAATGHDLSIRFFPGDGVRLRDSGQLAVAESIRARLHASWRVRLEVPVSRAPDRRAADMVLENREEMVSVEIERALLDLQAQLRSAQLKRAALAEMIARPVRLVIAVPDTDRNRRVVATIRPLIEAALPVTSRRAWASLGTGMAIGGDALLWVRGTTRESADPRGNKAG